MEDLVPDFMKMGFDDVVSVSCIHRRNIGDLIDCFTEYFWKTDYIEEVERVPICIVGRPKRRKIISNK